MTNSLALYRPSILELAREGNFRAIGFWINSLLGPYGIYVHVMPSKSGQLNILVDFKQPRKREFYLGLRKHLVKFICYRLWTLNSEKIRDVRIVARVAGEQEILWKQSVRIVTPANREQLRQTQRAKDNHPLRRLTRTGATWIRFQMMRSAMVSRIAVASFFLCYWLSYWQVAGKHAGDQALAAMSSSAIAVEQVDQSTTKGEIRAGTPAGTASESSIASLGRSIQQDMVQRTVAEEFQGKVVYQTKPAAGEKVVALTFDDGPWPTTTEQVLDILKQENIKATFFWVGQALQSSPDIARKVVADGHAIGNHTWRHIMDNVDDVTAASEIGNTARLIYETTGLRTNLFRPPGGNLEGSMVPYAKNQKNVITMWSAESDDYMVSAPIIVDNVLSRVQPGGIVLMHDGGGDRSETVKALPQIITALKRQGYEFVTVPELLARQAKEETVVQPPSTNLTDPAPFNSTAPADGSAPANPTENPAIAPTVDPTATPGVDALNGTPASPTTPTADPTAIPSFDNSIPGSQSPSVPSPSAIDPQQSPGFSPPIAPSPDMTGTPSLPEQAPPTSPLPDNTTGSSPGNLVPATTAPTGDDGTSHQAEDPLA